MVTFKEFLAEKQDEPEYFLIEVPENILKTLNIALESHWQSYDNKWSYRVDPADPSLPLQRHVHIAQKKHTSSKTKQVSWNIDGTRHDKKSFNDAVGETRRVREIAKTVLGLSASISLESYIESTTDDKLLLECLIDDQEIKILLIH